MNITKRLKVGGESLLFMTIISMVLIAFRVISSGDQTTGVQLIFSALLFFIFMWLGWIQPKITGVGLILLGSLVVFFFGKLANNPNAWKLLGVPFLISGLLFLGAGWEFHQNS